MSEEQGNEESCRHAEVEAWELLMVAKVSRAFRTDEREELEAELARKLAELKNRMPRHIRQWNAYLAKFLYNKGLNWVRNARRRERMLSLIPDRSMLLTCTPEAVETNDHDFRIAMNHVRSEIDSELRLFWDLLIQKRGNRSEAAREAGIHRNTARLWILQIRRVLERHGF